MKKNTKENLCVPRGLVHKRSFYINIHLTSAAATFLLSLTIKCVTYKIKEYNNKTVKTNIKKNKIHNKEMTLSEWAYE